MRLFAPDLFRNFGIGFALGALLIVGANVQEWGALAPPARAAEPVAAAAAPDAPTAEFVIAP